MHRRRLNAIGDVQALVSAYPVAGCPRDIGGLRPGPQGATQQPCLSVVGSVSLRFHGASAIEAGWGGAGRITQLSFGWRRHWVAVSVVVDSPG